MIQCPECRNMIPDDSAFCDQCGKELKWCPECKRPKRGMECPVCGSDLEPGRKYLSGDLSQTGRDTNPGTAAGGTGSSSPVSGTVHPAPEKTATDVKPAVALSGNGMRLILRAGAFGRRGGIWPELASCIYVSGNHGVIGGGPSGWTITDSGSTNGTKVNGVKLEPGKAAAIKTGDIIRIATLEFTVQ